MLVLFIIPAKKNLLNLIHEMGLTSDIQQMKLLNANHFTVTVVSLIMTLSRQ